MDGGQAKTKQRHALGSYFNSPGCIGIWVWVVAVEMERTGRMLDISRRRIKGIRLDWMGERGVFLGRIKGSSKRSGFRQCGDAM